MSVDELRASVNLEGEDPQDVLYVNIIPLVELPGEQTALDEPVGEGTTADVNVEPKVEQTDDGTAPYRDSYMGTNDEVPGPDTNVAGVNALPTAPEQDQQMTKIEAQVLGVLADDVNANEGAETDAQMTL